MPAVPFPKESLSIVEVVLRLVTLAEDSLAALRLAFELTVRSSLFIFLLTSAAVVSAILFAARSAFQATSDTSRNEDSRYMISFSTIF
jgi:hypothetical protein